MTPPRRRAHLAVLTLTAAVLLTTTQAGAAHSVAGTATAETYDAPTPTILGDPRVGSTLTVEPGSWGDEWDLSRSSTFAWRADGSTIIGALGGTYTPGPAQLGARISVTVTGYNAGESVSRTSCPTMPVTGSTLLGRAAAAAFAAPTPTISGVPRVGGTLSAEPGSWGEEWDLSRSGSFAWHADGSTITGALGSTYTPGPAQLGAGISVTVTGYNAGESVSRTSCSTGPVVSGALTTTPTPTITGTPQVGTALQAVPGTWDTGVTVTYQWHLDGNPITGATSPTYTPTPTDLDQPVSVTTTGSKTGYASTSRTSTSTAPVISGALTTTPTPTITGTPQVGTALQAVPGTWDTGVTVTYQWHLDGNPITGATSPTYTPTPTDLDQPVSVTTTGSKTGYASTSRTSTSTAPVISGALTTTPTPTITGTPQVGTALQAVPGTWDTGVTVTYQWHLDGNPITGATSPTYTPTPTDLDQPVSVTTTGSKTGYASTSRTSTERVVAAGVQSRNPKPRLRGKAKVGKVLRVVPTTYDRGTSTAYTWYANGDRVGGHRSRLKVTGRLTGQRIRVKVTASKPGYLDEIRASAKTARVR